VRQITSRIAMELIGHEAIVREWYLDNAKPPRGTWSIGITNASGHKVDRYKDNPQPITRCLEVFVWLLRSKYLPEVLRAFGGRELTETELGAALSWHWNTGAILTTSWVKLWLAGSVKSARAFMKTHYLNNGALTPRREAEAALFFDGIWSVTGTIATVWPVKKPSYTPDWAHPQRVDIGADLTKALVA